MAGPGDDRQYGAADTDGDLTGAVRAGHGVVLAGEYECGRGDPGQVGGEVGRGHGLGGLRVARRPDRFGHRGGGGLDEAGRGGG
jgi:hypothetical protein